MSETHPSAELTGAQSLVRSLEYAGAEVVFGIPGGAILPAYDPLYDSEKVRHILVRHEQGAGHAAEGYAMVTGKVGVCMATSGPGATNLVTPIADAHMDSVPIVAITGQVASAAIGTDAFQEADIRGITHADHQAQLPGHQARPTSPPAIASAFHIAGTGRPGPVLVDITKDALQAQATFALADAPRPAGLPAGDQAARQAGPRGGQKLISESRRPVLYVGGGVLKAGACEGAQGARRADRHPGGDHADGPRASSPTATRRTWACPACTARWRRSAPCSAATC